MNYTIYTTLDQAALEKTLHTNITTGLTNGEVTQRLKTYGFNQLQEHKNRALTIFIRQLTSPFVYLLLVCALLSFLLEPNAISSLMIIAIVIINTLLGFMQEYRAERIARLLKQHIALKARVKRNNNIVTIESKELVPGDIVLLQPGDYVPADMRFIQAVSLSVDESSLTGESASVHKQEEQLEKSAKDIYSATNMGFLGTIVTTGSAIGVVTATGSTSEFGAISHLALETEAESGFQIRVKQLSMLIMHIIIVTLIVLFVFHLLVNPNTDIIQLLLFSISLAIGITPEALPVVTTFSLSRGALALAKNNVIVKRLSAIEDLGSISILCTDKTGTLTENKLTVKHVYTHKEHNALLYALLGAEPEKSKYRSAIDTALWEGAPHDIIKQTQDYTRIKEIPFDSFLLRNIVLLQEDKQYVLVARGAYEEIIKHCIALSHKDQELITQWINEQSALGHRILAVAYKTLTSVPQDLQDQEYEMHFVGLVALEDPLKPTSFQAVQKARKLGVSLKMLTGDSKEVAYAIARQVDLVEGEETVITGAEFSKLTLLQKQKAVQQYTVFARVIPQQKYEIISLLKAYATVGYLGDGINDAPALKIAHVGISVHDAVDIAADTADIVLLRKSLNVIINGIDQGRIVFTNILKYIRITISANFGGFYSIAIASLFTRFLPLLPLQILLINMLSDFPMTAIATDSVDSEQRTKPSSYNLKDVALLATFLGLTSSVFDAIFFALFYKTGPVMLRTILFTESILTELILIFSARTRRVFYKAAPPSWPLILLTLVACAITLILPNTAIGRTVFNFTALPGQVVVITIVLVLAYFIATEFIKLAYYTWSNNNTQKIVKKG